MKAYKPIIYSCLKKKKMFSALVSPLFKGLTEVVTNQPRDPVTYLATYLYNFANQDKLATEKIKVRVYIWHIL